MLIFSNHRAVPKIRAAPKRELYVMVITFAVLYGKLYAVPRTVVFAGDNQTHGTVEIMQNICYTNFNNEELSNNKLRLRRQMSYLAIDIILKQSMQSFHHNDNVLTNLFVNVIKF